MRVTPGRRRQYCSDICRASAEKGYKQALAAVGFYEELLEDAKNDVAAFGRTSDEIHRVRGAEESELIVRRAHAAWSQARAAVEFASAGDERLFEILKSLVEATDPMFTD